MDSVEQCNSPSNDCRQQTLMHAKTMYLLNPPPSHLPCVTACREQKMDNLWQRWGMVRQRWSCHRTLRGSQCPILPRPAVVANLSHLLCALEPRRQLGSHRWHVGRMMAFPACWDLPYGFWLGSPYHQANNLYRGCKIVLRQVIHYACLASSTLMHHNLGKVAPGQIHHDHTGATQSGA